MQRWVLQDGWRAVRQMREFDWEILERRGERVLRLSDQAAQLGLHPATGGRGLRWHKRQLPVVSVCLCVYV